MTDVLVVAGEPLWPADGGSSGRTASRTPGRTAGRTAALVAALAERLSVRVLAPVNGPPPPGVEVAVDPLPDEEPVRRVVAALSPQPRRGRELLGPRRTGVLLRAVADHQPRAILFAASYLSAAAPTIELPTFVDFPTLAVAGSGSEAVKARWWEPVEARRAVVASASSAEDVAVLETWGARAVLVGDGSAASALVDAMEQAVRPPPA